MPWDIMVCMTSLVRLVTLHENSGGCDGQVCVTEQETVIVEPASTSAGTWVMTGFSGEAEHLKQKVSNVVDQEEAAQLNHFFFLKTIDTFHNNEDTAIIEFVFALSLFCIETEGPVVKRMDAINL